METEQIVIDRGKARELWRDYRKHQHWSEPIDREVMHTYQAIAQRQDGSSRRLRASEPPGSARIICPNWRLSKRMRSFAGWIPRQMAGRGSLAKNGTSAPGGKKPSPHRLFQPGRSLVSPRTAGVRVRSCRKYRCRCVPSEDWRIIIFFGKQSGRWCRRLTPCCCVGSA